MREKRILNLSANKMLSKSTTLLSFILLLFIKPVSGQFIINGDFSSGTSSWGCGVEVNTESTYGGSSSNAVVEVDAGAGLCQTITGLTIGYTYLVSFSASRRTGGCPSPAITNIDVTVSGGALSTTITRTNTTFGFTSDYFIFIASSTSHVVNFAAGAGFGGSTCGMIMDNFAVSFSPLPITLLNFEGSYKDKVIKFEWSTASEKNNAYFEIERSNNGINYTSLGPVPSKAYLGNSSTKLDYTSYDNEPAKGINYYRLKQVDFNNTFSYSPVISVSSPVDGKHKTSLYPNPNGGEFTIETGEKGKIELEIINHLGKIVYSESLERDSESNILKVNTQNKLQAGLYHCRVSSLSSEEHFNLVIQ